MCPRTRSLARLLARSLARSPHRHTHTPTHTPTHTHTHTQVKAKAEAATSGSDSAEEADASCASQSPALRPCRGPSRQPDSDPSAAALQLRQEVEVGLRCGSCLVELVESDVCIECTSLQPDCQRQYHTACILTHYSHLYTRSQLRMPQPNKSKWRCMGCSAVCALCLPAAKIVACEPFFSCCHCSAKTHQDHFREVATKICPYCLQHM